MATKPQKAPAKSSTQENDLSGFESALKLISSACEAPPDVILTAGKKNTVTLSASNNGNEASYRVICQVANLEPGASVSVPTNGLQAALKGRKTGTLKLTDRDLVVVSGTYRAQVTTSEADYVPNIQVPEDAEGSQVSHIQMTPELHSFLTRRVPLIRIEKTHSALADVMLTIRLTAKEFFLAAYDGLQVCGYRTKADKEEGALDLHLDIAYTRFASFLKDLTTANCDLYVTPENLTVVSALFRMKLLLPLIDPESIMSPEDVYAGFKDAAKQDSTASVSLHAEELKAFLENSKELMAGGTSVQFEPSKSGVVLRISGMRGSTSLTLKGAKLDTAFSIDNRFVTTLVQKQAGVKNGDGPEQVVFDLIQEGNAFRCTGNVTYIAQVAAEMDTDTGE